MEVEVIMGEEVTIPELDELIKKYVSQKEEYEEKKKISSKAYEEVEKLEAELLDYLDRAGKSKYFLDGIGTVYQGNRLAVKIESNRDLFAYITKKYGEDALLGMQTINYQKVNAFYKSELEAGEAVVPGLSAPVAQKFVGLRRKND